jgi:ubiquinone/menaquinone biosynthesis C-methylase UbiE
VGESDRILAEYARRETELPAELYAPTNPAQLFIQQSIERALPRMLRESGVLPLAGRRVLDVGCGYGSWLADLETLGAERERLAGIDLFAERVEQARARLPGADIRQGDAAELPFEKASFDLVLQSMMFSSILDPSVQRRAAAEMSRVLAPGGVILWYDFFVDNPRNPNVRGVSRRELQELFPGFSVRWRRVTLAPPLARALVPRLRPLASALQALRVLNTHAMATLSRTA